MMHSDYQGWKNFETWYANLLLTQTQKPHKELQKITHVEMSLDSKAEYLKGLVLHEIKELALTDLTPASLNHVDWQAIIDQASFDA